MRLHLATLFLVTAIGVFAPGAASAYDSPVRQRHLVQGQRADRHPRAGSDRSQAKDQTARSRCDFTKNRARVRLQTRTNARGQFIYVYVPTSPRCASSSAAHAPGR